VKILNLYAGLGGNRKLWGPDQDITAVEMDPKIGRVYGELYPDDNLVIGDAHAYLLENSDDFDFIWSSPPCQSHSKMVKATRHRIRKYPDMSLYEEIIFLRNFFKGKWIVENVKPYYEPLISPNHEIGRHLAWCNFHIEYFDSPKIPGFINIGTVAGSEKLKDWLGINYEGNIYYGKSHCPCQVLRNCVHPDMGLHIFKSMTDQQG
jgi:DNA (cytosine-5)-methyltransferase 1